MKHNITTVTAHYLTCAAWSDSPDDASGSTFGSLSRDMAYKECANFVEQAGALLDEWNDEQIGHDFWLTRNHHGAGFWDRDLPNGDELTELAQKFPERSLYVSGNDELEIE